MSDHYSPLHKLKFEQEIGFTTQHSPFFVNKASVNEKSVALTLIVTNDFLRNVQNSKDKHGFAYVEIINTQIACFQLKPVKRLESGFQSLCSKVVNAYRKNYKGGNKREMFNKKVHNFAVFKDELENYQCLNYTAAKFKEEKVLWEKRCKDLYNDLYKLQTENTDLHDETRKLKSEKKELLDYIQKISPINFEHSGKGIDDLSDRQSRRQIRTLETYAKRSLWFAETFGILPEKILCKSKGGKNIILKLSETTEDGNNYSSLSECEKQKVREIMFITDKFCISDAAYHELTMVSQDLPRSYLLVQSRNDVNEMYHIERLPGNVPGAYIDLNTELERLLKYQLSDGENKQESYMVKFSGDGAKVSRISNFVIFSISFISDETKLSFNKQHTIGIVKCDESYENLSKTCRPIFDQMSELTSKQHISINDTDVKLEFFVGGDLKFLQIILGWSGSTANFACPWCKVHKNDRHDTSKPWDFYHSEKMCRTVSEISKLAADGKKEFGVKHKPFLNVELNRFIPDELHLMMRVTDVLIRNLIDDAKDKGGKTGEKCLDKLVDLIRSCGVSFNIWTPKDTSEIEWTCLSGSERVKVMKELPDKLINSTVLNDESKNSVVSLWSKFYELYQQVNRKDIEISGPDLFLNVKEWINDFLDLGKYRKGYTKSRITPYMHCLCYHVPYFIYHYGSLKKFSGQGVEKNNDIVKMIHQKKSNKWDAACESLRVRKRIEFGQLENLEREKRYYNKTSSWWDSGLLVHRETKRRKIDEEIAAVTDVVDFPQTLDTLTEHELRLLIKKQKGVSTKIRKREKLIEMLEGDMSMC